METTGMDAIERVQNYLRRKAQSSLACGSCTPFSVFADPTQNPSYQFVIPDQPLVAGVQQVVTELQVYAERQGIPARAQFVEEYMPAFADALREAGFRESWRNPIMITTADDLLQPDGPELSFRSLSFESNPQAIRESWEVNMRGFDREDEATDEAIRDFQNRLITGRAFIARLGDAAVASAMYTEIWRHTTELVGIATLPEYRRQGIAAAVTAHAAEAAFASGVDLVFLTTASEDAARIYERIGFQRQGSLVQFSDSPAEWMQPA
jgi:ribosomal protein S18 acetylase RimI-like enzyme